MTTNTPNLTTVINRANASNLDKITDAHVKVSVTLVKAAQEYMELLVDQFQTNVTPFIESLWEQWYNNGCHVTNLSDKQLAALLNFALSESRKYAKGIERINEGTSILNHQVTMDNVPNGIYTVVLANGEHRTIRIEDSWNERHSKGHRAVSYLHSGEKWQGFAFITPQGKIILWGKYKGLDKYTTLVQCVETVITSDKNGMVEMGKAYALESGKCWKCNRTLTTPESIANGIGPICANSL